MSTPLMMIAAMAALSVSAPAAQNGPASSRQATEHRSSASFVRAAAEGGKAQEALAATAEQRAQDDRVKALAGTIRRDHQTANVELRRIAADKNASWPESVSDTHRRAEERLQSLSGRDFDKAYTDQVIRDHRADIQEFEKHRHDTDPAVARWVAMTLPVLQRHLKLAEEARREVDKGRR